jgi:hypothetical protein
MLRRVRHIPGFSVEAEIMKTRTQWTWVVLLATLGFLFQVSTKALAQDDTNAPVAQDDTNPPVAQDDANTAPAAQDATNDQDPPSRVARLNTSDGSVSFRPGGEDDWVSGVPNRPLVTGDDLWADENSRAEVHIGSTALRLGAKTGITFLTLDDKTVQLRLAQGSLILKVRHVDDDDTYEVDTPNLSFAVLQPGEYRIDVSADGNQTVTTVWHGRGRVTGGGSTHNVVAGQSATFTGGTDHLDYDLGQIPREDDFDRWAFGRDDREDHADSANYVSREMTGYEDLDEYGDWSYVAGYGPCWRPRAVAVGWAPYRFGHWVWIGPWGWTWVEDEPWGFAPFHYGRWAAVGGGWFWVPGPVVVRPVWAPALVAFVGGGPGFRFSVGVGVGWFPLGPGEVFVPGYRVSRRYVNNVNITNTTVNITKVTNVYNTVVVNKGTNINRIAYMNQHVNGGVTVVSHDAFVNARPVAQNVMRVDQKEIDGAPTTRSAGLEPVRQSVLGAGRPAPARPPAAVVNRQVVAQRTPAASPRSFAQREAPAGGHMNEEPQVRPQTRPTTPANESAKPRQDEGFRPFTPPSGGDARQQTRRPMAQERATTPAENRNPQTARPSEDTHPLVRQAPPVRERNPQQEQEEEQKFHKWQQQRPAAPERREQPSRPPAQKQEKERPSKPKGR